MKNLQKRSPEENPPTKPGLSRKINYRRRKIKKLKRNYATNRNVNRNEMKSKNRKRKRQMSLTKNG